MYSNVNLYKKEKELHGIPFPVRLGGLMRINASCENSNTSNSSETKIILLMFTGSQDLYLGVYTNLIMEVPVV